MAPSTRIKHHNAPHIPPAPVLCHTPREAPPPPPRRWFSTSPAQPMQAGHPPQAQPALADFPGPNRHQQRSEKRNILEQVEQSPVTPQRTNNQSCNPRLFLCGAHSTFPFCVATPLAHGLAGQDIPHPARDAHRTQRQRQCQKDRHVLRCSWGFSSGEGISKHPTGILGMLKAGQQPNRYSK